MTRRILPVDLSNFIGREAELAQLGPLLKGSRLLSLVGAGGAGKTRLAIEAARRHAGDFTDGVCLVDLAGLTDPRLVPQAVASALALREQARRPLVATLSDGLREKNLMLILDNCEHVLAECAALADAILRVSAHLTIVVTSRTRLGVAGEVVYRVPSMPSPPEDAVPDEQITHYDAVRLFLDRARSVRPEFRLTATNAGAVVQICRRLDGIPLALELAAARLNVLTVEQIITRLDDRFRLLTGGSQTALPRHRTLQALMDWSFDLLTPQEQVAWRRLAIFAGDFSLEAAEPIVSGAEIARDAVLDLVGRLADQSVVVVEEAEGGARYRMLETVRQHGMQQLRHSQEEAEVRARHLDWVLSLSEQAESEWRGPNQVFWLQRIDRDLDNIRAALDWARHDSVRVEIGLRIAAALWLFWQVRGHFGEGRMWLDALPASGDKPTALRAKALNVRGFLAYSQGETATAIQLLEQSLATSKEAGDEPGVALALLRLGIGAYYHGDLARAVTGLEESLARYRLMKDPVGTHIALYELGEALSYTGEYRRARQLHEEGLALKRQLGDRWHIAFSLFGLGLLDFLEGRYGDAAAQQRECLRLRRELDDRWGVAMCLEVLGWVDAVQGRGARAARLLGAADAARNRMGATLITPHLQNHGRAIESVRVELGVEEYARQWRTGETLDADGAYRLALEEGRPGGESRGNRGLLTPREVQIANLVASGLTNREIGRRLSIAERTADAHLEHIMNKLGVHSRLEIARWADQRQAEAKK